MINSADFAAGPTIRRGSSQSPWGNGAFYIIISRLVWNDVVVAAHRELCCWRRSQGQFGIVEDDAEIKHLDIRHAFEMNLKLTSGDIEWIGAYEMKDISGREADIRVDGSDGRRSSRQCTGAGVFDGNGQQPGF